MPRRDDYDYDDEYDDRPRSRRDDDRRYDDDDDGYDDYDRRPRRRDRRQAAAEKVTIPAIFMMILGALGFLLAIANAAFVFSGAADDEPNPFGPDDPNMKNDPSYIAGQVIATVVTIGWGLLVFFGGLQMKKLSSRGFVMFSSILVMLPCNWCCVIGIAIGIWALVVLNDDDVKRSFT
jgi:hypothetical protein